MTPKTRRGGSAARRAPSGSPTRADEGVAIGGVLEAVVLEVLAGPRDVVRVRIARPETPTSGSTWTLSRRSRLASVRAWTVGVEPGLGHALPADEVDGHAAGLEQAGRRVDDRLEDLAPGRASR